MNVSSATFAPVVPLDPLDDPELDVPFSSLSRVASAWARVALAEMTARSNAVGSRVATVWPAKTVSPTATGTVLTVPAVLNDAVAWLTFWAVPFSVRVCSTDPVVTVPRRYDGESPLLATARVPKKPPATSTTTRTGMPRRSQTRLRAVSFAIMPPSASTHR